MEVPLVLRQPLLFCGVLNAYFGLVRYSYVEGYTPLKLVSILQLSSRCWRYTVSIRVIASRPKMVSHSESLSVYYNGSYR